MRESTQEMDSATPTQYLATFLAVIQIVYLSFKAHKSAREHENRQSLSREKIKEIVLSRKAI